MIANIVDHRRHPYRWKQITAIVEDTWHDNSVAESDQADRGTDESDVGYAAEEGISLADAVKWANAFEGQVTLFLYDFGDGTRAATEEEMARLNPGSTGGG